MSKFSLHFPSIISGQKKEFYQTNGGLFDEIRGPFLVQEEEENCIKFLDEKLAKILEEKRLDADPEARRKKIKAEQEMAQQMAFSPAYAQHVRSLGPKTLRLTEHIQTRIA